MALVVHVLSGRASTGSVTLDGNARFRCALGRSGRTTRKREGDGASPAGRWRLVEVLYRGDRVRRPQTGLPVRLIRPGDGWCDAPDDPSYNRRVRLPYGASAEELWRQDNLYDLLVVLDHNRRPRRRHGGSAIFLHVARPAYEPTAGCVALREAHLRRILGRLRRGATIVI